MLDTCVIVAAIKSAAGASHRLVDLASTGKIIAVLTVALLNEYQDVIFRPGIRSDHWKDSDLDALIDSLLVPSETVECHFTYRPLLDDPGDELVLEAAINGHADIVTFNAKHFKPAARFGIQVITPGEALERFTQRSGKWSEATSR